LGKKEGKRAAKVSPVFFFSEEGLKRQSRVHDTGGPAPGTYDEGKEKRGSGNVTTGRE